MRKLIAGPSGFSICDECVELCMDIIREESKTFRWSKSRDRGAHHRRRSATFFSTYYVDRAESRQEGAFCRSAQSLQAPSLTRRSMPGSSWPSRISCVIVLSDRFGQDAARADAGASSLDVPFTNGRCDDADRGGLCR